MLPSWRREETIGNTKVGVRRELWPTLQKLIREKDLDGDKDGGILEALQSENRPLQRILSRAPRQYSGPPSSQNLPAQESIFIPYNRRRTLREPYYFVNVAVHDYCPHPQEQFGATERLANVQFTISYFCTNTSELQPPSKSVLSASENGNNGGAVTFNSPEYSLKLNERFYKVRLFESYLFRKCIIHLLGLGYDYKQNKKLQDLRSYFNYNYYYVKIIAFFFSIVFATDS